MPPRSLRRALGARGAAAQLAGFASRPPPPPPLPASSSSWSSSPWPGALVARRMQQQQQQQQQQAPRRGLAVAAAGHGGDAAVAASGGGLAQQLEDERGARQEAAYTTRSIELIAEALAVVRGGGQGVSEEEHRVAVKRLGFHAANLAPADAIKVVHQALDLDIVPTAHVTLKALRTKKDKGGVQAITRAADALVLKCCRKGLYPMAVGILEDVQLHPDLSPPPSRKALLAVLRLVVEGHRPRRYWRFAERSLNPFVFRPEDGRYAAAAGTEEEEGEEGIEAGAQTQQQEEGEGAPAPVVGMPREGRRDFALTEAQRVLAGDAELVAAAALVCWRATRWGAVERLLRCYAEANGLSPPLPEAPAAVLQDAKRRRSLRTVVLLEALLEELMRRDAERSHSRSSGRSVAVGGGPPRLLTTAHCNMLVRAQVLAGRPEAALALVEEMAAAADASGGGDGHGGRRAAAKANKGKAKEGEDASASPAPLPLPLPDDLSFCIAIEAMGEKHDWAACARLLSLAKGGRFHFSKSGLAMIYKTAIAAAGKCGLWEGALALFFEVHERGLAADVELYTALLAALKGAGQLGSVQAFLDAMQAHRVTPTRATYNVLFSALGAAGRAEEAVAAFRSMEAQGLEPTFYDLGTLIAACGRAVGAAELERRLGLALGEAEARGAAVAEGRLVGLARELLGEAERLAVQGKGMGSKRRARLEERRGRAAPPAGGEADGGSNYGLDNCYLQMMKVLGKAGRWRECGDLLEDMRRFGVPPTFSHYHEAMRAAALAKEKDAALALLDDMMARRIPVHVICWNAAVLACSQAGDVTGCFLLLERMRAQPRGGLEPGNGNYARAIAACGTEESIDRALGLVQQLRERGWVVDQAVQSALLRACGRAGRWAAVPVLLAEMEARDGERPDGMTLAQAVAALALDNARVDEAVELLLQGQQQGQQQGASVLAYHAAMVALIDYSSHGDRAAVARTCEALVESLVNGGGLCPTAVTVTLARRAGCSDAVLDALAGGVMRPLAMPTTTPTGARDAEGSGGGVGLGEDWEGEAEAGDMSYGTARRRVLMALGLNPHDGTRRWRLALAGAV